MHKQTKINKHTIIPHFLLPYRWIFLILFIVHNSQSEMELLLLLGLGY